MSANHNINLNKETVYALYNGTVNFKNLWAMQESNIFQMFIWSIDLLPCIMHERCALPTNMHAFPLLLKPPIQTSKPNIGIKIIWLRTLKGGRSHFASILQPRLVLRAIRNPYPQLAIKSKAVVVNSLLNVWVTQRDFANVSRGIFGHLEAFSVPFELCSERKPDRHNRLAPLKIWKPLRSCQKRLGQPDSILVKFWI